MDIITVITVMVVMSVIDVIACCPIIQCDSYSD